MIFVTPPGRVPRGRHLHLEPLGGIAGDMFLGAAIDLGLPLEVVASAVGALDLAGVSVTARREWRGAAGGAAGAASGDAVGPASSGAIEGIFFEVLFEGRPIERAVVEPRAKRAGDGEGEGWSLAAALERVAGTRLPLAVRDRACALVGRRFAAEAAVAGIDASDVVWPHLEAIDTLADLVGAAAATVHLAPESVTCGPLPPGRGGNTPPGEAIVRSLLAGRPRSTGTRGLTTPTGAVLVAELVDEHVDFPPVAPEAVGYGLGRRDPADHPNVLRLVAGPAWQPWAEKPAAAVAGAPERPVGSPTPVPARPPRPDPP